MEKILEKFITEDGKINIENLESTFETILNEAEKSNKGNKAAARRFRIEIRLLEKTIFRALRGITPKKK